MEAVLPIGPVLVSKCSMARQPEGRALKHGQEYLRGEGARFFKIHGGDPFQEVGIPDLLCCYRGRFVGIEWKLPGEQPSPMQLATLHEIERAGGYAAVCSTVEQVASLLSEIDTEVGIETSHDPRDPMRFTRSSRRTRKSLR